MKSILRNTSYQLLLLTVLGIAFFSLATPVRASAFEMTAQTIQVIPPGGTSCAPIAASNFKAYIYEGSLHSFEFSVPDASYVALMGSIGDTGIPFQLMTRRIDMNGVLTIHVDVSSTPVIGSLPLQVTLLSARTGQPVCLGIVSLDVGTIPQPLQPYQPTENIPQAPVYTPALPPKQTPSTVSTPTPETTGETVTPTATETVSVVNAVQNPLRDICTSEVGAYRVWLILLVLFTLLVGGALWAEFPMALPWARTPERIATIILALLLALLAFWYLSVSCRAALWMPLLAFFIAILGLLAAFWNHPRVTQLLLVEDSKTIKLPPAK